LGEIRGATPAEPDESDDDVLRRYNGYLLHRLLPNHAKNGYRRVLVNH
jgi:hypothetical protein